MPARCWSVCRPIPRWRRRHTQMKTCPDCKQNLLRDAFGPNRANATGLQTYCRSCTNARVAIWKSANREKIKAKNRAYFKIYYEKNKSTLLAKKRTCHVANKEKIREQYRASNQKFKNAKQAWRIANAARILAQKNQRTKNLVNSYVRERLLKGTTLRPSDIPASLIHLKRSQLQLLRELKKETL